MASIFMPESNRLASPYIHESSLAGRSKSDIWSKPAAALPATAAKTHSTSSVWGSPLSLGTKPVSPSPPSVRSHHALAALAATSEPVASAYAPPVPVASAPSTATSIAGSPPLEMASRQNSANSQAPSPVLGSAAAASAGPKSNDEIINTAIVVKNIPFAIKKEQLIEFMTQLGLPLPYAFNYHFDSGVFRGLAFANFSTAEETSEVISTLNGRELGGRRLRVEYKKMLPYQERERIEREKRERRGQLEEQHQKTEPPAHSLSSASLASMAEPPALATRTASARSSSMFAVDPVSPAGVSSMGLSSAAVSPVGVPPVGVPPVGAPPVAAAPSLAPGVAFPGAVSSASAPVDMNDPEVLDTYTSLLIFKRDAACRELVMPASQVAQMSPARVNILSSLCERLDLVCGTTEEQGVYIAKRAELRPEDNEPYLSGLLKNAVPTLALTHPSLVAPPLFSNGFPNGLHRWSRQ